MRDFVFGGGKVSCRTSLAVSKGHINPSLLVSSSLSLYLFAFLSFCCAPSWSWKSLLFSIRTRRTLCSPGRDALLHPFLPVQQFSRGTALVDSGNRPYDSATHDDASPPIPPLDAYSTRPRCACTLQSAHPSTQHLVPYLLSAPSPFYSPLDDRAGPA